MNVEEAEEQLRDYLLQGIGAEIFWADEAYALALEIDKHAEQINAAGFGALRTSLVTILSDRQTLSITKIFDPPNRKYPTRSIPVVLDFLEEHAELWKVPQWHKLHQTLIESGADPAQVEPLRNAGLTHAIVAH